MRWDVIERASAGSIKWIWRLSAEKRKTFEDAMRVAEQKFLHGDGLPRRPWFRHTLHAPGPYTGYG
jgi:N-acetylated-alpha-linked acidic dipeptidase